MQLALQEQDVVPGRERKGDEDGLHLPACSAVFMETTIPSVPPLYLLRRKVAISEAEYCSGEWCRAVAKCECGWEEEYPMCRYPAARCGLGEKPPLGRKGPDKEGIEDTTGRDCV